MKIVILGGGPAGLYSGLLIKKACPAHDVTILERNPAGVTYGWGVVFSDRTLASFQRADERTYEQITGRFVIWDAIDVYYRDTCMRCGGHVIASIARKELLAILQERCQDLGVMITFDCDVQQLAEIGEYDLLIAADGLNSLARRTDPEHFAPTIQEGRARYIWLGAQRVLDAFTFLFCENEHGLFQVHAYPFSGQASTFIVECDEASWLRAGLDQADETQSLAYCQRLLAPYLRGAQLLSNSSKWINFPTLKTRHWQRGKIVLLGDAAHTAHFSIGSGTRLAMEDAIALAGALERHADLAAALDAYELERKPVVEVFQRAAGESQIYFETLKRFLSLAPMPFAFQLLTRSGRISYDDLRLRDIRFGQAVDRWFATADCAQPAASAPPLFAPAPLFASFTLRELRLPNRVVVQASSQGDLHELQDGGAGLLLTPLVAVTPEGRITPEDPCLFTPEHLAHWRRFVERMRTRSPGVRLALQLGHAGRRGSTRPCIDALDLPLRTGSWPLLAPSPLPYTLYSQIPEAMGPPDMQRVREAFVQAARLAEEADFDLLGLHWARGYLLASFLSPLTNQRTDEYGGDLTRRMRYPLEIFDAVRAVWPQCKPLAVTLQASDGVKGGLTVDDALQVALMLKDHGCDLLEVQAGQATPQSELPYGPGYLTALSARLRNEAGLPTMLGGYLTTSNEINTILAAGRGDLCIVASPRPAPV
ncbi:MAG TPA: FAD-dependent monooxygenase [Ktedonobacteraceae bacterium]|jgi:anthraniloyl-CoA monooxygenase